MKKPIIAIVILGVIAFSLAVFTVINQMTIKSNNELILTAESNLSTIQVQGTAFAITVTQEFQSIATKEVQTEDNTRATIESWQSKNSDLQSQLNKLKSALICQNVPNTIDFTSNQSVSTSIKKWLENSESIETAKWETIWNNSKVTLHKLTGKYLYEYIVFFEDSTLNYHNAVFDIQYGCWLSN